MQKPAYNRKLFTFFRNPSVACRFIGVQVTVIAHKWARYNRSYYNRLLKKAPKFAKMDSLGMTDFDRTLTSFPPEADLPLVRQYARRASFRQLVKLPKHHKCYCIFKSENRFG